MKSKTSKQKYNLIKILGAVLNIVVVFIATSVGVAIGLDTLWQDIPSNGITSFYQWITLVIYRLIIYLGPGFVLSFFVFDKRYKYISRLKIWLNWTFGFYLFISATISVFAIDKVFNISIFENIDAVVLLTGYIVTIFTKDKVEFDSTGAIINPKEINMK